MDPFTAFEEGIAQRLGGKGWKYRDIPGMSRERWEDFMEIIGRSNCRAVAVSLSGAAIRGQLLISPEGMRRLADYNRKKRRDGSS